VVISVADDLELEEENNKEKEDIGEINENKVEVQPNVNHIDSNEDNKEEQKPEEDATVIATSPAVSEISKTS